MKEATIFAIVFPIGMVSFVVTIVVVGFLTSEYLRRKRDKKQQAKCDAKIAAREAVAKAMNGIVLVDKLGSWGIMPERDWMKMRKYDEGCTLDEKERTMELETRKVVAATINGTVVRDRSGYWGIVPNGDWIRMQKYDSSWVELRKYDKLFNGKDEEIRKKMKRDG